MSKNIAIIGAGPAGVLAAITLLEGGLEGSNITLIDNGDNPWDRETLGTGGFMGAALGSGVVLAGEPDMGGNLCQYFSYEDATHHIDRMVEKLKNAIINSPAIKVGETPYKHCILEAETYTEIAKRYWLTLTQARVTMVKHDFSYFPDIANGVIEVADENFQEFDHCIVAAGGVGFNLVHGHFASNGVEFMETLPIDLQKQAFLNQNIPGDYIERIYKKYPITSPQMNVPNLPKIYLIGDAAGNCCLSTALVQGMLAAEDIIANL
jgi:hypothetical protein